MQIKELCNHFLNYHLVFIIEFNFSLLLKKPLFLVISLNFTIIAINPTIVAIAIILKYL